MTDISKRLIELAAPVRSSTLFKAKSTAPVQRKQDTLDRYEPLRPLLEQLIHCGMTRQQIAHSLIGLQVKTASGGVCWSVKQVSRVLDVLNLKTVYAVGRKWR